MRKQLSLWPVQEETSQTLNIWDTLDHQQQKQIITALTKLIKKTVCQKNAKQTREVNNER